MLVLALAGRLGLAAAPALRRAVVEATNPPNTCLVIDFAAVDYLSSAGLRALKEGLTVARERGIAVAVTGLEEPVRLALELDGLLGGLQVETSREAAVARVRARQAKSSSTD